MRSEFNKSIDLYFVKVELAASYVLQIPAETKEEALREAYRAPIPTGRLYEIDKTATICGPSYNEIMKKVEERTKARRQKRDTTLR